MPGWDTSRPVYHRLPIDAEQYQGNIVVDALTAPFDAILVGYKVTLENFYTNFLNPDTARVDALDWLAQLCGFTGEYWDTSWSEYQKRILIKNSHSFIWSNKGTEKLLLFLLNTVFNLGATIYYNNSFVLDSDILDGILGDTNLEYYILLPITYSSISPEWRLTKRLNRLYMPIFCDSNIIYDDFYLDYSSVGDILFS